jgi:hypothetical protein
MFDVRARRDPRYDRIAYPSRSGAVPVLPMRLAGLSGSRSGSAMLVDREETLRVVESIRRCGRLVSGSLADNSHDSTAVALGVGDVSPTSASIKTIWRGTWERTGVHKPPERAAAEQEQWEAKRRAERAAKWEADHAAWESQGELAKAARNVAPSNNAASSLAAPSGQVLLVPNHGAETHHPDGSAWPDTPHGFRLSAPKPRRDVSRVKLGAWQGPPKPKPIPDAGWLPTKDQWEFYDEGMRAGTIMLFQLPSDWTPGA